MAAVAEARALIEPPREEPEMPCGECGKPGHNALTCATIGKAPSEKKPATGGGARRKKPKPTTTTKATRAAAKARTPRRTVATRSPPFVPR
jgi:hypothetical protein